MAMNDNRKRIRFRRGEEAALTNALNTETVAYGQPIYDVTKNYLFVGDSAGNKLLKNLRPLDVRRVKGYFNDASSMSGVAEDSKMYWITGGAFENNVEIFSQGGFSIYTGNKAWIPSDPDADKTFEIYRNQYAQFHIPMRTDTLKTQYIKTSTNDTDAITLSNNLITLNKDLSTAYKISSTSGIAFDGATLGSKKIVIPSGTESDILGKVNLGSNNAADIINLNGTIRGFDDDGSATPNHLFRFDPSIGRIEVSAVATESASLDEAQIGILTINNYVKKLGNSDARVQFAEDLLVTPVTISLPDTTGTINLTKGILEGQRIRILFTVGVNSFSQEVLMPTDGPYFNITVSYVESSVVSHLKLLFTIVDTETITVLRNFYLDGLDPAPSTTILKFERII